MRSSLSIAAIAAALIWSSCAGASAGAERFATPRIATEGAVVTLGAPADPQAGRWRQVGGPIVALSNAASASQSFTAPSVDRRERLVFVRTASDVLGSLVADRATVVVDPLVSVVGTTSGFVQGSARPSGVERYLGVRYGAPPKGNLRWRAPVRPTAPPGVIQALAKGFACPQIGSLTGLTEDEDCLNLNIWTPAANANARLPVMVFLHGGGYHVGAGSEAQFDGDALAAAKGVIVLTLNYRLGPFGFFAHPALNNETATKTSGNYGVQDQILALDWVSTNIAGFGGDKARVTVFGESSGAASVCNLAVAPAARGLFLRAVLESGSCSEALAPLSVPPTSSIDSGLKQGLRAEAKLGTTRR